MNKKWLALPLLLASTLPGLAQYQYGDRRDHGQFYGGVRDGGCRGDYYGHDRRYNNGYDDRYNREHQGGIGPGKGALIGGAGGETDEEKRAEDGERFHEASMRDGGRKVKPLISKEWR